MIAEIKPSAACGSIVAPPSKSVAHRALILGALSKGCRIGNIAYSQDICATLDCLESMGAKVDRYDDSVIIGGLDPYNIPDGAVLFCRESGSTLRFLIPLCMLCGKRIELRGSERLFSRPLGIYEEIAKDIGAEFNLGNDSLTICGRLVPKNYSVKGNVSSQFITGLLIALPFLCGESTLEILGDFESSSYVDITIGLMEQFGIKVERCDNKYSVFGGQKINPVDMDVEGDCSNCAYLDAFNYVGSSIKILGVPDYTYQGDRVYKAIFDAMKKGEREFDLSDCPDLAPILFALAAALGGGYSFLGTSRLSLKESDRAEAMAQELKKFGAELLVGENSVSVKPCSIYAPQEMLSSHNDHRIVMALSFLCSLVGGEIDGAEAVSKSYPDYFEKIISLGIQVDLKCL